MKNKLSKLYKIFLAIGMVFSMCFNTLGMSVVNAYDPSVPKEFTRVKNIKYPESYRVGYYYCLVHVLRAHRKVGLVAWHVESVTLSFTSSEMYLVKYTQISIQIKST